MNQNHWSQQNERGHRFFLHCTTLMVRYLPLPLMRAATAVVCAYYYALSLQQRRNIRRYQQRLQNTYPQAKLPEHLAVYRQFAAFGEAIADRFAVWQRKIRYADLIVDDPDNVYGEMDYPADPRGQLLICSHLGNTEVCRALLGNGHHGAFKLNVLVHSRHAEQFNQALKEAGADDLSIIQVSDLDAATMLDLAARIERGEWLALAADRTPVRGEKTVPVQFLGHSAEFPQGAWLLAALLKAKTNTVFVVKHNGRYTLKLRKFQDIPNPPRGGRQQAVAQSAQLFADRLAEEAAAAPLQWFNFYDFWNDNHA